MLVAQVSDGKLQLDGFLDRYKVNADEYKEIIECFKQLDINSRKFTDKSTGKTNWEKIAEAIEGCEDNALSYFKTLDDGNGVIDNQAVSIDGLTKHLEKSGNGFISAASKAPLLNSAFNAGIFLAGSFVIQAIATSIDHYIHRVNRVRERTSELFDEFRQHGDSLSAQEYEEFRSFAACFYRSARKNLPARPMPYRVILIYVADNAPLALSGLDKMKALGNLKPVKRS